MFLTDPHQYIPGIPEMLVKTLPVLIGNIHEIFDGDFFKGFAAHHLMHGRCNFLFRAVAHGKTSISASGNHLPQKGAAHFSS